MTTRGSAGRSCTALLVAVLMALGASSGKDPLADRQYHVARVRAPDAWSMTRGGSVVIAVLDTGVDATHPDLRGRLVAGIDIVDPGTTPDDVNGHGTFVAGVAVATLRNAEGGRGVAPEARVMPVRVLDDEGMGRSDDVAEGIRWATRNGASVINLSLVDASGDDRPATAIITTDVELAIRQAALEGVVVVAAAGNDGSRSTPYSRDLPALIAGASTRQDGVWVHSNRDDRTLFAPGVGIVSTYVGDPYAIADGTSFAAPIISAAAAMLLDRDLDGRQARQRLTSTARPIGAGAGRVDVAAALGIAPRVRSTPSPRPSPSQTPAKRQQPRPVSDPSPAEAEQQPERSPDPPPPPPPPPPDFNESDVAQAPVVEAPAQEEPSPLPVPAVADPTELAAPGPGPPDQSTPWVPIGVAGALLFVTTVAVGGYITARRADRSL